MKSYCNCPHCGQGIALHSIAQNPQPNQPPEFPPGFNVTQNGRFETAIENQNYNGMHTPPPGYTASKKTPTRSPNVESDFVVPIAQSLVISLIVQAVLWLVIGSQGFFSLRGFFISFFVILGFVYVFITVGIHKLMYIYEEITSKDDENKSERGIDESIYYLADPVTKQHSKFDLPIGVSNELWMEFCYGVWSLGKPFGRDNWARQPYKIMEDSHWRAIREHCEKMNYVTEFKGDKGNLTAKGNATFEAIANRRTRLK